MTSVVVDKAPLAGAAKAAPVTPVRLPGSHLGDVVVTHTGIRESGWYSAPALADELGRSGFVKAVAVAARVASPGTVVSIEGPWGSGKTHVLAALTRELTAGRDRPESGRGQLFWLNPWLLGEVNLLARLCELLVDDVETFPFDTESGDEVAPVEVPQLVTSLLPGLMELVVGGAGLALTLAGGGALGELLKLSAGPLQRLLARAFDNGVRATGKKTDSDPPAPAGVDADLVKLRGVLAGTHDPVERFQEALCELVHRVRRNALGKDAETTEKLHVFIDDLDRCLPEVQVELMKQLHFLTKSGASIVFIVALDPRLLEDALRVHYKSDHLDAAGYVHKLFHVRAPLPFPPPVGAADAFVQALRAYTWPNGKEIDDRTAEAARAAATAVLVALPKVTPRAFARVAARIHLAVCGGEALLELFDSQAFCAHVLWSEYPAIANALVEVGPATINSCSIQGSNSLAMPHASGDPNRQVEGSASRQLIDATLREGWFDGLLRATGTTYQGKSNLTVPADHMHKLLVRFRSPVGSGQP